MSIHLNYFCVVALSLALLPVLTLPVTGSEFREQMAAWQGGGAPMERAEPTPPSPSDRMPRPGPQSARAVATASWEYADAPGVEQAGFEPACDCGNDHGPACGQGCGSGCGACGDGCNYGCNTMVWARFETLLWWRQGRDFPPLVTTDPINEPFNTAGRLPDATILFGNGSEASDMTVGGHFDIGTWFDPRQCYGVGWRFLGLANDGLGFSINSLDNPVLAIPFSTINPSANDALVISYPGVREGQINISGESELFANDVYGRFLLCRNGISRVDFITGYHFSRINDGVTMSSTFTDTDPQSINFGSVTAVVDQFEAQNEFHGGILGIMWERDCGCWTTQVLGRMSIGGMRERVLINGSFTFDTPAAPPVVTPGGLFTAPSNIGTFERTEFTAVTEVGVTCAYRFSNCTQLTAGYTFMYWHDVMRPGDAIDPVIDLGGPPETRPQFAFNRSSYWVQGLNLGLEWRF